MQHQSGPAFNRLVGGLRRPAEPQWRYRGGGWVHASDVIQHRLLGPGCRRGCCARCGSAGWTCTAIPTAAGSPRSSRPGIRAAALGHARLDLPGARTRPVVHDHGHHRPACLRRRLPGVGRVRLRRPRARLGPDRRAGRAAGPRAGQRRDHDRRRHQGPADGDRRDPGQPGQQRGLRPRRLPRPRCGRAGLAASIAMRRRCCVCPRCHWASTTPTTRCPSSATACISPSACTDYVQLFSRSRAASRCAQRSTGPRCAVSRRRTFAPFSLAQWTSLDQYTEAYSGCLRWPSPHRAHRPITGGRRWCRPACPCSCCPARWTR